MIRRSLFRSSTILVGILLLFTTPSAFAGAAGGGGLPWETPLNRIAISLTGPVALSISLIALMVAGGTLVFGGELSEFARLRPEIDPTMLAPVRPVEYTARDGTKIHAYLTLPRGREAKGLPLVVLPHGGPYEVRDTLSYDDEVQLLANRGYAVLQPNFRGSGGYGESFSDLGKGEIGRRMQDDLDDAVDWAAKEGLADPARVCLVGASYGGYAALWGAIRNPDRYRCAASFAGVTEWDKQLAYDADFFSAKGRREWRERVRGADRKFDLDSVSPARQAAQLRRPVLLVHGKKDTNVPFSQFEAMRNAINRAHVENAEFIVLADSGHGFDTVADEQAWYDALLAFLAKHNPAD